MEVIKVIIKEFIMAVIELTIIKEVTKEASVKLTNNVFMDFEFDDVARLFTIKVLINKDWN